MNSHDHSFSWPVSSHIVKKEDQHLIQTVFFFPTQPYTFPCLHSPWISDQLTIPSGHFYLQFSIFHLVQFNLLNLFTTLFHNFAVSSAIWVKVIRLLHTRDHRQLNLWEWEGGCRGDYRMKGLQQPLLRVSY